MADCVTFKMQLGSQLVEIELSDDQEGRCKATCRQLGLSAWGSSLDNAVSQVVTMVDACQGVLAAPEPSGANNP